MKGIKKTTLVALALTLIGTASVPSSPAKAAENTKNVVQSQSIEQTQNSKSVSKTRKDGKKIEVVVPSNLTISNEQIQSLVDNSSEKAIRINISGITKVNTSEKVNPVNVNSSNVSSGANSSVSPAMIGDTVVLTQTGYQSGAASGLRFVICTAGEGQTTTLASKFTHTDSYTISGEYNSQVISKITGSYNNSTTYEVSASQQFSGPAVDANRTIVRYFYGAVMYNKYNFIWQINNIWGSLKSAGTCSYFSPSYYLNWSEDIVL